MHRNTFITITILAVTAALLTGINIGRRLPESWKVIQSSPATIQPTLLPQALTHSNTDCGISFQYDPSYQLTQSEQAVTLTKTGSSEQIRLVCAQEMPRPPLPTDKIEDLTISGVAAKLYHDASAKDGSPVDVAIFTHPTNKLTIGLFGYGAEFDQLVKTVNTLP